ncbi:MAG: glycoside hydrolase family 97 protein [Pseudomonadota bacterium]
MGGSELKPKTLAAAFLSIGLMAGCAVAVPSQPAVVEATSATPIGNAVIASPDGTIVAEIAAADGQPAYSVTFNDRPVVAPSNLGLRFKEAPPLDAGFEIVAVRERSVDATWEQPWGEARQMRDRHNAIEVDFADATGRGYTLEVRVFNDGLGFRYHVPETICGEACAIVDELTEFSVDAEATAWWTKGDGFNRYEYIYETTPVRRQATLVHTPYTLRSDDGIHVAIHEAALVDYAGMSLRQERDGVLKAELRPWSDGVAVRKSGAFKTPWRTLQIAADAAGLVKSSLILNLNEPNALGNVDWVEPGKYVGIWWGMHINEYTWGSGPKHGATTDNAKRYIDFAAEHGFAGVLIEGWNIGWDGDWFNNGDLFRFTETYPDFDLEAVSAYAAENGVRLIGHHETSGNVTNYEIQLEDALDLYAANGVAQIKTGYVADASDIKRVDEDGVARYEWHDGQYMARHHLKVLQEAAERQISINAHEPIKDTGLRRTYPNAISREGARGMEFNAWGTPPNPPEHESILIFTRMLAGPMDFTPGIFNLFPNGRDDQNRPQTTLAKQLALYVTLYSPIQMAADLPRNYEARMDAFQFIKDVPVDWEQSIALAGNVGDYAVIARQERGSENWYLGAVSDEEARTETVTLDFLDADKTYIATIYADGAGAHWDTDPYPLNIYEIDATAATELTLRMAPGGGAAVAITAKE